MTARRAALISAVSIPAAIFVGDLVLGPAGAIAIVVLGVAIGWRYVPGFWRTVARSAIAGGLAGLLVLGPGYRLAMRIVAILDDGTTPEFTIDGTLFLIVGVGAIFGGVISTALGLVLRTFASSRRVAVAAFSVITFVILFADSEPLSELTTMGLGALFNVPMFFAVTVVWAWLADRWGRPIDASVSTDAELVSVP